MIKKVKKLVKIPLAIIVVVALVVSVGSFIISKKSNPNVYAEGENVSANSQSSSNLPNVTKAEVKSVVQEITAEELKAREAERLAFEIKQKKIVDLKNYLLDRGSVGLANASQTLIEASARCGVDYKLMVSIAGYESSYGKIPVKKYNPFGWLNGVQYGSWDEAINDIVCDFGSMYKGLTNPHQIVKSYVGSNGDKPRWANAVGSIMNTVP